MTATLTELPKFFVCIRRTGPKPRAYPVVKLPDGTVKETTWEEYRASLNN